MTNYKSSGVDIEKGDKLVEEIRETILSTKTDIVQDKFGGFCSIIDTSLLNYKNPLLLTSTDGVGTKLILALQHNKIEELGQDLVAMSVNDISAMGGVPIFFLDYFSTSKLDLKQTKKIISSIAASLKSINCALVGGETAEMPGLYKNNEFDIAGFVCGIVEKEQLLSKSKVALKDKLIGISSSGFHSNGYSLIRKLIENKTINCLDKIDKYQRKILIDNDLKNKKSDDSVLSALLEPTIIYSPIFNHLSKHRSNILSAAHITGGGIATNLKRALPKNLGAKIDYKSWAKAPIFDYMIEKTKGKISDMELFSVFNMGLGFILVVEEGSERRVINDLSQTDFQAAIIGEVCEVDCDKSSKFEQISGQKENFKQDVEIINFS